MSSLTPDPSSSPSGPSEAPLPVETEIYGVLDTLGITCGHAEAQAIARWARQRIESEVAQLLAAKEPQEDQGLPVSHSAQSEILPPEFPLTTQVPSPVTDERLCLAQEWQRDGRGLWAMRSCRHFHRHSTPHDFEPWRYNVLPPERPLTAPGPAPVTEGDGECRQL